MPGTIGAASAGSRDRRQLQGGLGQQVAAAALLGRLVADRAVAHSLAGKRTSHYLFKTPWPGDPRVNIQNKGGKAKPYQVKQVLTAIKKWEERS